MKREPCVWLCGVSRGWPSILSHRTELISSSQGKFALLCASPFSWLHSSSTRSLPIAILPDPVGRVNLQRWSLTGKPEYQSAQLAQAAFVEGVFKGCRSKEINLTPPPPLWGSGFNALSPLHFFGPRLKTSHNLCYSLLLDQRPSSPASTLHSPLSPVPSDPRWMAVQIGSDSNRTFSICSVRLFLVCSVEWPWLLQWCATSLRFFFPLRWELACAIYVYIKTILIAWAGLEIRKVNCF